LRAIDDMTVTGGSFTAAGTVLFEVTNEAQFTQTGVTKFDPLLIVIDVASSLPPNGPPFDFAAQSFPALVKGGFPFGKRTGTISLGTFVAPGANLLLALGNGAATATNIVAGTVGVVGQAGSATLNGSLSGILGPPAAGIALKSLPSPDPAYRFNNCTIETFCAPLVLFVPVEPIDTVFTRHVPFPASDIVDWLQPPAVRPGVVFLSTSRPRRPYSDPTIDTLNIGVEDLF
jgi:hypothetical protein